MRTNHVTQTSLAATTLLLVSVTIVASGTATGYEISLYDALPPAFWLAIVSAFSLYALGLTRASLKRRSKLAAVNLGGLTATYFFLLALPVIRYRTYYTEWDVWFHLGDTAAIARTGHVNLLANYYPTLHLIWAALAQITGMSVYSAGLFLGPGITALCVPFLYIFSARMFRSPTAGAIAAVLGAIPDGTVGMSPAPGFYALTMLLVVLYSLLLRQDRPGVPTAVLALLFGTALAISHPLTPIFAILAIAIAEGSIPLFRWVRSLAFVKASQPSPELRSRMTRFSLYLMVTYITWVGILTLALRGSIERLVFAVQVGGFISAIQYGRFLTIGLVLKLYCAMALLGLYWLSGALLVLKRGRFQPRLEARLAASVVIGSFLLAAGFQGIAAGFGVGGSATVPLTVAFLFLPILGGAFLKFVGFELGRGTRNHAVVAMAVLIPFALGAAAMYPSPYVSLFNYQNTAQVYSSVEWSAKYLPNQGEILSNSHMGRYAYYPLRAFGGEYEKMYHWDDTVPSNVTHFVSSTLKVAYLILDKETIEVASMNLRAWDSPSSKDLSTLNDWPGSARIYDNGEVQVYAIIPSNSQP